MFNRIVCRGSLIPLCSTLLLVCNSNKANNDGYEIDMEKHLIQKKLDGVSAKFVDLSNVPGMITAVYCGDKQLYIKHTGFATLYPKVKVNEHTKFIVASMY